MIRFHTRREKAKIAKKEFEADCNHIVKVGEAYYEFYESDPDYSFPVLELCSLCVVFDD